LDHINLALLLSRWFHIAAAIVAIGGAFFVRCVLLPGAKAVLSDADHERLREAVKTRWRLIAHACIVLLLVTGVINFFVLVLPSKVDPLPYHPIFAVKVVAALGIFFIASALAGRGTTFEKMRRAPGKWLTILLVLAGLIVLLSGALGQLRTAAGSRPHAEAQAHYEHDTATSQRAASAHCLSQPNHRAHGGHRSAFEPRSVARTACLV
jgi:hypothetical protein